MPSYHVDLNSGRVYAKPQDYSTEHLVSTIPLGPGETYYLVYVGYTTGNSYGRDPETWHELVDAYHAEAEAVAVAKAIREHYRKPRRDDAWCITIRYGNGAEKTASQPWLGYFERLGAIHVLPISTTQPVRLTF